MQQHAADFRTILHIIEGEMYNPPAQSVQIILPIQRVAEPFTVHILHMALVTVTFQAEFSVRRKKSNIQKLRFTVPVVDLILRMQIIQIAKQRPPDITQKQLLCILMPP